MQRYAKNPGFRPETFHYETRLGKNCHGLACAIFQRKWEDKKKLEMLEIFFHFEDFSDFDMI